MGEIRQTRWGNVTTLGVGLGMVAQLSDIGIDDIRRSVANGIGIVPIGFGSNLIGSDESRSDLLICRLPSKVNCEEQDESVHVGCGIGLYALSRWCAEAGYGGLSSLSGIPGTVGGALKMNAGANGVSLGEFVEEMHGYDFANHQEWHWSKSLGGWSYRHSPIPDNVMVLDCRLKLPMIKKTEECLAIEKEMQRRRLVTPVGRSAGSIFQNPVGENMKSAGWYLEQAGCKGLSSGNLTVSQQHANWIVNLSGQLASRNDFNILLNAMHERVMEKFGVNLRPEVRMI